MTEFKVSEDIAPEEDEVAESDAVEVTNNYRQEMDICGTRIAPGETSAVPDFDPDIPLMAAYLKAKVISVG